MGKANETTRLTQIYEKKDVETPAQIFKVLKLKNHINLVGDGVQKTYLVPAEFRGKYFHYHGR